MLTTRGLIMACPSCGQKNRLAYERLGDHRPVAGKVLKTDVDGARHAARDPHVRRTSIDSWRTPSIPIVVELLGTVVADRAAWWRRSSRKVAARNAGKWLVVKGEYRRAHRPWRSATASGRSRRSGCSRADARSTRTAGARPAAEIEKFIEQANGVCPPLTRQSSIRGFPMTRAFRVNVCLPCASRRRLSAQAPPARPSFVRPRRGHRRRPSAAHADGQGGKPPRLSMPEKNYIARIDAIDRHGPALHSVIEINPDALADRGSAGTPSEEEGPRPPRGPLHGHSDSPQGTTTSRPLTAR